MELTCAFILVMASLVLATPHGYGGYGVKGGASARAEASASAGAFGGIPVPVPLGAGYSRSFSKSSSSSSASSSASSSSSSSSFSYSGSGAGGFGLNGGVPNHGGCSTGNCHTAAGNGLPTPHGASGHGYNSANAAASAQAGAVPESGCQGLSCDDNSDKCKSGPCKSKPHSGTTPNDSDSNKCTSGQCGSAYENGVTPTDYDSNDIRAVSDSSQNANAQNMGSEKSSLAYDATDSDCSHGKCGSSGSSNSKPNNFGHDLGSYNQGSSATNKQQGPSFETGTTSQYQKPSSHLETPKLGSKCTSGNCYPTEHGHENAPSSYNVPIHGTHDNGIPKPSCDGVKCENQPKGPYSSTDKTVTKGPSSYDYPSSTNCEGSSCLGIPANQATGRPTHTVRPSNVQFGQSPSNAQTLGVTGCNTPNCSPYPTNPAGSIAAPGHIGHGKPADANKVSNDKLPAYTGGFGGPAGVLNPNEYDFSAPSAKPLAGAPAGCNSPSCSGYPSTSRPTGGSVPEGTYNHKPGGNPSDKLPTYTGGFGGPSGMLKPNEYGVHGTATNNPNFAHNSRPSYNAQPPAGNFGTLGCKAGETCGGYTPTADATSGATAPSGYYGTTKPNTGIHSNDGFGGPGAIFNPDKHNSHATGPSSPGYTPTASLNTPISSGHPGGCKTANCFSSFGSTAAPHAQAETFGVTKPSTGPHLSSVTLPAYTSSFDKQPGIHKPSGVSGPASTPSFTQSQPPYSPSSYSTGCQTGNCANGPISGPSAGANAQSGFGIHGSSGVSGPASAPGFTHSQPAYSTGCKTGDCANGPISGPSAGANAQSGFGIHGSSGVSGPASAPGFTHSQPAYSTGCKTGNCANGPISGPSAGANAQFGSGVHGSSGVSGPASSPSFTHSQSPYSPNSHSNGCKTGNCANGPTSGPEVGSTPSFTQSQLPYSPGSYPTGCQAGNCANSPTSGPSAGANAQSGFGIHGSSGISGPAPTPSYTHSQPAYSPGSYSTGCETGNCANGPITGPSAGANAQSGSFGVTKPNTNVNSAPTHPQYTGGFGAPSGTVKPNEHSYVTPSTGSAPTNCRTPNCVGSPSASADATSGANARPGSYGVTKPSGGHTPSNEKPIYTGGFGGAAGLLKPNEYTVPAVSSKPNNKPTGVPATAACTSGTCDTQPHGSAPHSSNAASGAHATAVAAADANAIIYSGGFGGPPGVLAPYDDGKIAALPTDGKHGHGSQTGGAHGSHNANINSQHGTTPVGYGGLSGPAGGHGNTGAQAGSLAGATAYAGATAGASAGAHGHNPHGSHYNHEGNIKGGSPCGGGCGGSGGGAGSSSSAAAKSISGANAFGVGGSYASSSASAHASAGAYTKGGYGKR